MARATVSFSFDVLDGLSGHKAVADTACPVCGPDCKSGVNQRRKVLRIWSDGDFITYTCARCERSGYALRAGTSAATPARPRADPAAAKPEKDKAELARFLWSRSLPLAGSLAETYLRARRCFLEADCLRFLPARGDHHAAMIARFGTGPLTGVHLTKLRADGLAKAGTENDKIIIGPSMGQAIVLLENDEREEVNLAEGIEDAASLALATGWSSWAAGTANRIPAVVASVPATARLFLASDMDWGKPDSVRAGPRALRKALDQRPDLVALHFEKMLGIRDRVDANQAMIRFGSEAVLAVVEICEAQARFAGGEIGFEVMMRTSSYARAILTGLCDGGEGE